MEEDIMQMKFQELRQYAKQLGLTDIKKSMNKEQIIEAINKFKENLKPLESELNGKVKKVKTKSTAKAKSQDENAIEQPDEEPKQVEKQTKKKKTKKGENLENLIKPESVKTPVLKPKENIQEEAVKEISTKIKKSKRNKKEDQELVRHEPIHQENEQKLVSNNEQTKKKKVAKKGSKENKQNVEEQKEVENKKPKKTKKSSSKNKQAETRVSSINANLHEDSQETKDFKLELEDDENSQHHQQQTQQDPVLPIEPINNLNNSSLLTNDFSGHEDSNQVKPSKLNEDPNITEDIQNNTFDKSKPDFNQVQNKTQTICINSTVVAEQPISTASNNHVEPSTFVPCTSFYKQQNKESVTEPTQSNIQSVEEVVASPKPQPKQGGARIVRPKQTITEIKIFKQGNSEVEVVTKKVVEVVKNEAGPRIVKPTILYANEVCETTESNKRKINETGAKKVINNKTKKPTQSDVPSKIEAPKSTDSSSTSSKETKNTIVAKAVPDFKAIHQKEEKKMESLGEYLQRKQERFAKLTNSVKTPSSSIKQNPVSRLFQKQSTTESSKATSQQTGQTSNGLDKPKIKTPTSSKRVLTGKIFGKGQNSPRQQATSTPKLSNSTEATATLLTDTFAINIPKISQICAEKSGECAKASTAPAKQAEKPKQEPEKPKTESARDVSNENKNFSTPTKSNEQLVGQTKTPASTLKRVNSLHQSSLLKSAQKVQQYKLVGSTFQPNNTSTQSQSAFERRKSFDLNASLSKPLSYNPHIGKLKPVDFSAKSIFLSSITANLNNETKIVDKSNALKQTDLNSTKTKSPKALELAKKRLSTIKMSGIRTGAGEINRNMITEQAKINNLKTMNDESLQSTKKFRQERTKQQRMQECDKRRQVENNENIITNN